MTNTPGTRRDGVRAQVKAVASRVVPPALDRPAPALDPSGTLAARWLFFRRFLAHPARLAAALPSSHGMARMVASRVWRRTGEYVVELGAGTGAVTRALLDAGIPASRLVIVEIDEELACYLDDAFPGVAVVHGSAHEIADLLPEAAAGRVGTVVCGVPVSLLPRKEQAALADAMLSLLPDGEPFFAYTYRLASPLPSAELGLAGARVGFTLRNVLPASVWAYRRAG